jgi:Cu/Ag efflux protein CusF
MRARALALIPIQQDRHLRYAALALLLAADLAFGQSRETLKGSGTVVAVDHELSRVTIDTDPIEELKLPALGLAFVVYDRKLLGRLRAGRKIEFEFIRQGRNFVLVRVLRNEL